MSERVCSECGEGRSEFKICKNYKITQFFAGDYRTVTIPAIGVWICNVCGEEGWDDDACKTVDNAFKKELGLMLPEEIRKYREDIGVTREKMSSDTLIPISKIIRYESGHEAQTVDQDRYMRCYFGMKSLRDLMEMMGQDEQ